MTNKEWLDYLAHNAPDELAAWFDAEHVEHQDGTLDGDIAAQDGDLRDKLEADVRKIAEAYNMDTQRHGTERFEHELYYSIIHLLNRQRSIDDSICDECSSDFYELQEKHDKLEEQVDKLTAERDKLQEQLRIDWECECRLQAERDELQEQVDALRSRHCPHYDATEHTCDVHRTRIAELTAEREQYRKLFGMALDWAHEITMLETSIDEGMA